MMRRRLSCFAVLVALTACGAPEALSPRANMPGAPSRATGTGSVQDGRMIPGSGGSAGSAIGEHHPLACTVSSSLFGSAVIGPSGGELIVGPHRLIVPAGALLRDTQLSGTIPAGSAFEIHFEPSGLQFKKPAGLVIDVSLCADPGNVVYLDEQGGILQHIQAVFSTWWHTVAAPIDHFSGYMLEV